MLAARFYGARDVRVEDVPEPDDDLGPNEVLVSNKSCGICGTDLHEYLDGPIQITREPHPVSGTKIPKIIGHEFAGDVEAVGSAVKSVKVGDRVSIMPLTYCGECYYCRRGLGQLCPKLTTVGLHAKWGGFASHAVVKEYQVASIPDEVSYEQGALIEPAAVAVNTVQRGRVQAGDAVLITGGGPIGALTVLAARAAGAGQVFVSEPNAKRAARLEALGVDAIFDPRSTDVVGEVHERTEGQGVDAAMECSGNDAALRACLKATRTRGTIAQVAIHVKDASFDAFDLTARELSLVGVWAYGVNDWPRIAAQVKSGTFPIERVVTSNVRLDEIVEKGFEPLVDPAGDEVKILVNPAV